MIKDNFDRVHNYLRISLTDRCNLRCFYCMPENGIELIEKPNIMSLEEIIAISKIFISQGVDTIRLTGGEPLIRKNFDFLIKELAKLDINLKLTTNGILLDRYLDVFREVGLKKINISIDSLDKSKAIFMTKRDFYDKIMKNITLALNNNFDIKLNIVLIKGVNDNEIIDFIELTRDTKISIKFIEFMPFKGNEWDKSKCVTLEEILSITKKHFGDVESLKNPKHSTSINFKAKGFQGNFGIISTVTNPFCGECNRIRLTADGKMKNCLFANKESDLLTPFRRKENIIPVIHQSIRTKKFSRDGMELKFNEDNYENNRSMTAIGG